MFCPKCGQLNLDKVLVCQKCGARLPVSDGAGGVVAAPQAVIATGIYAGFWKRFVALILDYLILVVLSVFTGAVIDLLLGSGGGADSLGGLAGFAIWWLYYAFMESSGKQATLGKMALGIKVVDQQGGRISFARATGRYFAKILSGLILMIGYLMAGFTSRKQALHDMMAGCLVVNRSAPEELIQQGVKAAGMPAWAIVLIVLGVLFVPVTGILAAIALPAYQDYTIRAKVSMAAQTGRQATAAIEDYYTRNKKLPGDLKEAGVSTSGLQHVKSVSMDPRNGAVQVELAVQSLEGKTILFEPKREADGRIVWTCGSIDIKQRYLPAPCRK